MSWLLTIPKNPRMRQCAGKPSGLAKVNQQSRNGARKQQDALCTAATIAKTPKGPSPEMAGVVLGLVAYRRSGLEAIGNGKSPEPDVA